jgi:predicted amidohydrolase YtcJ
VPQQKISVEEALRAYTIGAAYAAFQESTLGSLQPGKLADLVVLGNDIFTCPPEEIAAAPITATIVGGKVVHRSAK